MGTIRPTRLNSKGRDNAPPLSGLPIVPAPLMRREKLLQYDLQVLAHGPRPASIDREALASFAALDRGVNFDDSRLARRQPNDFAGGQRGPRKWKSGPVELD